MLMGWLVRHDFTNCSNDSFSTLKSVFYMHTVIMKDQILWKKYPKCISKYNRVCKLVKLKHNKIHYTTRYNRKVTEQTTHYPAPLHLISQKSDMTEILQSHQTVDTLHLLMLLVDSTNVMSGLHLFDEF